MNFASVLDMILKEIVAAGCGENSAENSALPARSKADMMCHVTAGAIH